MLNFNSVMLNTGNIKDMSDFYEKVFDKKPDMQDGGYYGWKVGSCFFTVAEHSEVKGETKEKDRVLFNFETKDVKTEYERISKIDGIKIVKEMYGMNEKGEEIPANEAKMVIATLGDPDGNLFQLMTPWEG
jgi:predicted enzyme related to lactoylglutathione lyase